MAVTSYTTLRTELNNYTDRAYTTDQVDTFIGLAEAKLNRRLGPDYRRETSATLNTEASGEVSLPSGFAGVRSLVRDVVGSVPLIATSWGALIEMNPYETAGEATHYAIRGSTLKVGPVTDDNFLLSYWAKLTALTGSNATNWLLTEAPDVYFLMVQAEAKAFEEEWQGAAGLQSLSFAMLDDLVSQSVVQQYANAGMMILDVPVA